MNLHIGIITFFFLNAATTSVNAIQSISHYDGEGQTDKEAVTIQEETRGLGAIIIGPMSKPTRKPGLRPTHKPTRKATQKEPKCPSTKSWPELVGLSGKEAKTTLKMKEPCLEVFVI